MKGEQGAAEGPTGPKLPAASQAFKSRFASSNLCPKGSSAPSWNYSPGIKLPPELLGFVGVSEHLDKRLPMNSLALGVGPVKPSWFLGWRLISPSLLPSFLLLLSGNALFPERAAQPWHGVESPVLEGFLSPGNVALGDMGQCWEWRGSILEGFSNLDDFTLDSMDTMEFYSLS